MHNETDNLFREAVYHVLSFEDEPRNCSTLIALTNYCILKRNCESVIKRGIEKFCQ